MVTTITSRLQISVVQHNKVYICAHTAVRDAGSGRRCETLCSMQSGRTPPAFFCRASLLTPRPSQFSAASQQLDEQRGCE